MKKIMIIDDDLEYLDEIAWFLNSRGYEAIPIFETGSVEEVAKAMKPDVILLDLKLKGESGLNVALKIRKLGKTDDIPIIGITGYYGEGECARMIQGFNIKKTLFKPIDPEDIVKAIEEV